MTLSDDQLLADMRRIAEDLGHAPTQDEYNEHGDHCHNSVFRRFDSWYGALELALEDSDVDAPGPLTDERILEDIARVAEELGRAPSLREYDELGEHGTSTARRRFGSWSDAKALGARMAGEAER